MSRGRGKPLYDPFSFSPLKARQFPDLAFILDLDPVALLFNCTTCTGDILSLVTSPHVYIFTHKRRANNHP